MKAPTDVKFLAYLLQAVRLSLFASACLSARGALAVEALHESHLPPIKGRFADNIALFKQLTYQNGDRVSRYRLFVPTNIQTGERYPLLVWLHGYGDSGDDNWLQLLYIADEVAKQEKQGGFPCFVLAPQSPFEEHWGNDMLLLVAQLIQKTTADYPIDKSRIYLAGVSSGANACWRLAETKPGMISAMCPMATSGFEGDMRSLADVPIWAFRSIDDKATSATRLRNTISDLAKIGGQCWLTEVPGDNHDCWTAAFQEYHITEWLLKQRRGAPAFPVPQWARWKSFRNFYWNWDEIWPRLPLPGVLIFLTIYFSWRQRATKSLKKASRSTEAVS